MSFRCSARSYESPLFTQDDAHIFMTREQIKDEIKGRCEPD